MWMDFPRSKCSRWDWRLVCWLLVQQITYPCPLLYTVLTYSHICHNSYGLYTAYCSACEAYEKSMEPLYIEFWPNQLTLFDRISTYLHIKFNVFFAHPRIYKDRFISVCAFICMINAISYTLTLKFYKKVLFLVHQRLSFFDKFAK